MEWKERRKSKTERRKKFKVRLGKKNAVKKNENKKDLQEMEEGKINKNEHMRKKIKYRELCKHKETVEKGKK